MKKVHYTDQDIRSFVHSIIRDMRRDNWQPDYIVGLTRGGLTPANMLSQYLEIPMETLKVSLRDSRAHSETNCWMAEDAFGYVDTAVIPRPDDSITTDPSTRKKILIVDDINDTGATLNWIKKDWPGSCLPDDPAWNEIWGQNVRFAVLVDNQASKFYDINYAGIEINKTEEDCWIVFPWENWWA
jgi:hypoxanthine phosphoribosyltransferase